MTNTKKIVNNIIGYNEADEEYENRKFDSSWSNWTEEQQNAYIRKQDRKNKY